MSIWKERIGIIGTGNVAWHLANLFNRSGIPVSGILVRSEKKAKAKGLREVFGGVPLRDNLQDILGDSDIVIIAVNDNHIAEVAANCTQYSGLLCHTSGSVSLSEISAYNPSAGIFYPFQTLTRGIQVDPENIPFCIEATEVDYAEKLTALGRQIGSPVHLINSDQRLILHVSAVLACNFTNHLLVLAKELMDSKQMDFRLLLPLLKETIHKVSFMDPLSAQTGPAKRRDTATIIKHLDVLKEFPGISLLYAQLSESIGEQENQ